MPDIGSGVVIFLLIFTNFVLVLSETALVKARKARLLDWSNQGNAKAKQALEFNGAPNQLLLTVRMGTLLITVLTAAFGVTALGERLAPYLSFAPEAEKYSQAAGLGIAVFGISFVLLVFGELVPRRLALINPEAVALLAAMPMRALTKICAPAVHLLTLVTETALRLFGRGPQPEPVVTEEEIRNLVQQGTEAGVFEESEQDLVEAVFRLGDKSARSLMTPRTQIVWLEVQDSPQEIRTKVAESGHSRFPVCKETLDNVVGVAQAKDLLASTLAGQAIDLKLSLPQPTFVPRTMSALQVLEMVKGSGSHVALVVDEYGGIEGLLTHHDILEAIAGEIPLGQSPGESRAVQRHDGSWLLDGMLSVDEFKEIFHLENLPGEKRDAYQTLGGFIFTKTGRVPAVGHCFEWNNLRFEIVDMDGKRIDKVLVTPVHVDASTTTQRISGAVVSDQPSGETDAKI
jgi:putative hemolysin